MSWTTLSLTLAARALIKPRLALDLMSVAWRFRARDWFRHSPFLPLPDRTYLRWRMYTAFGDFDAIPTADEVERYARWATQEP